MAYKAPNADIAAIADVNAVGASTTTTTAWVDPGNEGGAQD